MEIRVFKGIYGWYISCKGRTKEGTELKYYMNARFVKCKEPMGDKADIIIKNGWHSCYQTKDMQMKPELVIMEYDEVLSDDGKEFQNEKSTKLNIEADELPFY